MINLPEVTGVIFLEEVRSGIRFWIGVSGNWIVWVEAEVRSRPGRGDRSSENKAQNLL